MFECLYYTLYPIKHTNTHSHEMMYRNDVFSLAIPAVQTVCDRSDPKLNFYQTENATTLVRTNVKIVNENKISSFFAVCRSLSLSSHFHREHFFQRLLANKTV